MQEATCIHCHTVVEIAPGSEFCSNCGEDLRELLSPEYVSQFYCSRANELLQNGQTNEALVEAELGLTYYDQADLRLLAAILSEETGRYDQMRNHVAAIPVDDNYRSEAEWLLRAHQERQSDVRQGAKRDRYNVVTTHISPELAEILGFDSIEEKTSRSGSRVWSAVAAIMVLLVIPATWFGVRDLNAIPAIDIVKNLTRPSQVGLEAQPVDVATTSVDEPVASDEPNIEETQSAIASVEMFLLPTPTPDTLLRSDDALADSNLRSVPLMSGSAFDLERYFSSMQRAELTELALEARLQGNRLYVSGIVNLDLQRREIVALLERVPGVDSVSTADMLLRPMTEYIVQDGDTLYSIVFDIYGDYDRVDEFYRENLGTATDPDSIRAGDILLVPLLQ